MSRGYNANLLAILLCNAKQKAGARELAECLNMQVGDNNLGTVDIACKCNLKAVAVLKEYGAVEQTAPPADWRAGRRRGPGKGAADEPSSTRQRISQASSSSWRW